MISSVIISVLSGAGICTLVMKSTKAIQLPPLLRWLLVAAAASNPFIAIESINGAATTLLMLFFCAIFYYVIGWLDKRNWLALASLGMSLALAVISHFNILALALLTIIVIGNNAWLEKIDQPAYTENAIWIVATPIVYVIFMRFLFSAGIEGNILSFLRFDRLLNKPFQLISSSVPALETTFPIFNRLLRYLYRLWQLYPPFIILTVLLIAYSAIRLNWNGLFFMTLAWAPILYAYLGRLQGLQTYPNRWILFIIPACFFMAMYILNMTNRGKRSVAVLLILVLLVSNYFSIQSILVTNTGSDYRDYLNAWLGRPYESDSGEDMRMANIIAENDFKDVLITEESAENVIAFAAEPARYITPLDEDYNQVLAEWENFSGYLLLDQTRQSQTLDISADPQRYQLVEQSGRWQLFKVLNPD